MPNVDEVMWQEYRSLLLRFVRKRVTDDATAEDIVHDVLLRAHDRQGMVRTSDRFEQWLYQVTRNAIIDHYRARRPLEALSIDIVANQSPGPEARHDLAACVRPLLRALPDRYRDAVQFAELDGLTQKDTAIRLGLSLSGAKSRVQRGRRLLEEKLLACCRVELDSRGGVMGFESRRSSSDCETCGPAVRKQEPTSG